MLKKLQSKMKKTLMKLINWDTDGRTVYSFKGGCKSYYPNQPPYQQWCKRYNVSLLYGKEPMHFD